MVFRNQSTHQYSHPRERSIKFRYLRKDKQSELRFSTTILHSYLGLKRSTLPLLFENSDIPSPNTEVCLEQFSHRIELILCTIPIIGTFNFSNMVIPLLVTCKDAFWPVETITAPATSETLAPMIRVTVVFL